MTEPTEKQRLCARCQKSFPASELSPYRKELICRRCYPRFPALGALRETERSPYMAFALGMLLPGAGQSYAGHPIRAYLVLAVCLLPVALFASLAGSARQLLLILLATALVVPIAALAASLDAARLVRKGPPRKPALRSLLLFLLTSLASLLALGTALALALLRTRDTIGSLFGSG